MTTSHALILSSVWSWSHWIEREEAKTLGVGEAPATSGAKTQTQSQPNPFECWCARANAGQSRKVTISLEETRLHNLKAERRKD